MPSLFLNKWFVSSVGVCLTASTTSLIALTNFMVDPEDISADSGTWDSFFTGHIKVARKDGKGVYVKSTIKNKEIKYYLYDLKKGFNGKFVLPFNMSEEDYSSINQNDIKIYLLKSPAWFNGEKDQFASLNDGELGELFSSVETKDHNKVKALLLKLSLGRRWKLWSSRYVNSYWDENDYYGTDLIKKPVGKSFVSEIKYFMNFNDLKNYILEKVKECKDVNECSPDENDQKLRVLYQDKKDFFNLTQSQGEIDYPTNIE